MPCVFEGRTIAVLALGRKDTDEPFNSEDLGLLTAVAGQVATAIENGRLYRQLHLKAEELGRMREFNENILESLDDGLVVFDVDERIVRWNRALEELLRRLARGGDRLPARRPVRRAVRRGAARGAARITPTARRSIACRCRRATARPPRLLVNATEVPLQNAAGDDAVVGMLLIIEDITDRVQLEEQLQISEKMASIGLLAAGVAHEVNTPLTGISSFTQMLLEGADPADPKTVAAREDRAADVPRREDRQRPAEPLAARYASQRADRRRSQRRHHATSSRCSSTSSRSAASRCGASSRRRRSPVLGIEHQLQQVFLNLFLNARDAMPSGGWLSVATRVEGDRVIAEVADTGSGIPSEQLARIYDPFFTTKAIGRGTGLGLSITYGIVREHDGTIHCDSAVGQGTRFTLALPMAPAAARAAPGELIMATSRHGTILVVDDEEIMREILETLLTREGYDVRVASSGAEGLEMARALPFDAAIVDIMMPGLDGIATLDELKRIDEDLNVIIITAYASVESAIAAMKTGAFDYITKPFKNDEVLVVVRNAMERRRLRQREPQPAPEHPGALPQVREHHRQAARGCGRCST